MKKIFAKENAAVMFPIYLTVVYLAFTLLVYAICPYPWPTKKPVLFYTLNLVYIAAIFLGYLFGQKYRIRFSLLSWDEGKMERFVKILSWASLINCIFYLIYVFRDYGYQSFDLIGLCGDLLEGIKNPGQGYLDHLQRLETLDGPMVMGGYVYTVLSLLWSFVRLPVAVLSLVYFKKLNLLGKIFSVFYVVLMVVYYVSIGTNIQFFHAFLLVELPVILRTFELWHKKELKKRHVVKLIVWILVGLMLVALYFGYMMESRSHASGYDTSEYQISQIAPDRRPIKDGEDLFAKDSLLGKISDKLYGFWVSFSGYLTQGYYGMSQALTQEWTPMFGLGNSMFLVDMFSAHVTDIDPYTYQVKLEKFGWDSDVRWHSMYTWLANDVSFYGVPVVMFLLGWLFSMMFTDAVKTDNPYAKASVWLYILMLVFIPCNNQIAQSNDTLFPFLFLVFMWLISGPKKNGNEAL